jgi:hypothetical protein
MALIDLSADVLLRRALRPVPVPASAANCNHIIRRRPQSAPRCNLPGILGSTRVTTEFGHVPAQLVRVGDALVTRAGRYLKVLQISATRIDDDFLRYCPDAAPVVIRKNSLRPYVPLRDVGVSPSQIISTTSGDAEHCLAPAEHVSRERGFIDEDLGMLVYYRFHLGQRAQICCDGIWVVTRA